MWGRLDDSLLVNVFAELGPTLEQLWISESRRMTGNLQHVMMRFAGDNNGGKYNDMYVRKLLNELSQVEREREQWRCERKEIQVTILTSKAEFERVWKKLKS